MKAPGLLATLSAQAGMYRSFQPPDLLALMHWARVGCPVTQGKLLEQETVSLAFHVAQCTLLA